MRGFCCTGCAAAAQWIHTANLDDYYALRSQPAGRADAEQSDLAAWDRQDVMAAIPARRTRRLRGGAAHRWHALRRLRLADRPGAGA
jgi:hypothetical protein